MLQGKGCVLLNYVWGIIASMVQDLGKLYCMLELLLLLDVILAKDLKVPNIV